MMGPKIPELLDADDTSGDATVGDLPEGWAWTTLGEACDLNPPKPSGDALPADAPVTFVPMPAVDAESGTIAEPQERAFADVRKGYTAFRDGDVLFAKITPCMENGKAAVARGLTNGLGFGSTEFHVLRPTGALVAGYVHHFVRQEAFRKEAGENMSGTAGQARVPGPYVASYPLPLPPLAEQQRIVAQVEAALARVDAARERLARVPALLRRFRQAVLAAACSGRLTADWRETNPGAEPASELLGRIREERGLPQSATRPISEDGSPETPLAFPSTWIQTTVGSIASVATGATPLRKNTAYYNGSIPWVTSGAVNQKLVSSTEEFITEAAVRETNAKIFPAGTLLVAMYGEGQTRGRVSELGIDAATNQALAALVVNGEAAKIKPYLKLFFLKSYEDLRNVAMGGVQPNLSLGIIRETVLHLPPLDEQAEIVRRVDALFALADAIEKRVEAAARRTDKAAQAVLAKAFRGELVPTEAELARREGRPYETADALLARVRADRAANSAAAPTARRARRIAAAHNGE